MVNKLSRSQTDRQSGFGEHCSEVTQTCWTNASKSGGYATMQLGTQHLQNCLCSAMFKGIMLNDHHSVLPFTTAKKRSNCPGVGQVAELRGMCVIAGNLHPPPA